MVEGASYSIEQLPGRIGGRFPRRFDVLTSTALPISLNLALDHSLALSVARRVRPACLRIWQWRERSVVMGSSQSLSNEIDYEEARRRGIAIRRRTSGGGTMYMDPAHALTYSLILPTKELDGLSFEEAYAFCDSWVVEALCGLGVPAFYRPLNDVATVEGKIGGAAARRLACGVTIHHATLSWKIDSESLLAVTRLFRKDLGGRGTRSAQKKVVCVRDYASVSREDVYEAMLTALAARAEEGFRMASYRPDELLHARKLAAQKFDDPAWIGRIP